MTTLHVGHDDHISGFVLTLDDMEQLSGIMFLEDANDYLITECERVEINEADLFLNMTDQSEFAGFKQELVQMILMFIEMEAL